MTLTERDAEVLRVTVQLMIAENAPQFPIVVELECGQKIRLQVTA